MLWHNNCGPDEPGPGGHSTWHIGEELAFEGDAVRMVLGRRRLWLTLCFVCRIAHVGGFCKGQERRSEGGLQAQVGWWSCWMLLTAKLKESKVINQAIFWDVDSWVFVNIGCPFSLFESEEGRRKTEGGGWCRISMIFQAMLCQVLLIERPSGDKLAVGMLSWTACFPPPRFFFVILFVPAVRSSLPSHLAYWGDISLQGLHLSLWEIWESTLFPNVVFVSNIFFWMFCLLLVCCFCGASERFQPLVSAMSLFGLGGRSLKGSRRGNFSQSTLES